MLNFKRARSLASNTVSGMNKGILFTNTGAALSTITCFCLTPSGGEQQVTIIVPSNTTYLFPVYTSKWTSSGGTVVAFEVN